MRKYFTRWYMNVLTSMVNRKKDNSVFTSVDDMNKYNYLFPSL